MKNDKTNQRIAETDFTKLHVVLDDQWESLCRAVNAKPGDKILDCMAGQGQAASKILIDQPKVQLFLLDRVREAVKKAQVELDIPNNHVEVGDACQTSFESEMFDTIVIKMGVHELQKHLQVILFQEMFRILKPGGKLILWNILLDKRFQDTFQQIVRKKDQLAGYTHQVENRYFQTDYETRSNLALAKFQSPSSLKVFKHTFDLAGRLSELGGNQEKLQEFQVYVRENFPSHLKSKYSFRDIQENISFQIQMGIYTIYKTC